MKTVILLAGLLGASLAQAEQVTLTGVFYEAMPLEKIPAGVAKVWERRFDNDGNRKILYVDFKPGTFAEDPVCLFNSYITENASCAFLAPGPTYQTFAVQCYRKSGMSERPIKLAVSCTGERL